MSGTDGATVNYTGAGSCVIDGNQAAGNGYAATAQVQQTITVNQAPAFVVDRPPLTATAGQKYDYLLSVSASTGELTGTPPAGTTSFTYTVTAANAAGTATAGPFTVHVTKAPVNADIPAALSCPARLVTHAHHGASCPGQQVGDDLGKTCTIGGDGGSSFTSRCGAEGWPALSAPALAQQPPRRHMRGCLKTSSRYNRATAWPNDVAHPEPLAT